MAYHITDWGFCHAPVDIFQGRFRYESQYLYQSLKFSLQKSYEIYTIIIQKEKKKIVI